MPVWHWSRGWTGISGHKCTDGISGCYNDLDELETLVATNEPDAEIEFPANNEPDGDVSPKLCIYVNHVFDRAIKLMQSNEAYRDNYHIEKDHSVKKTILSRRPLRQDN